jgi:catechol 2,3-dioxygenase-like lactoylglutathione lyase family enzyme
MNWTIEVVYVPVTDVDRAKAFYADQLGFNVDHDTSVNEQNRFVQLTPPGSGCSIVIGKDIARMEPGSQQGLQLVVRDLKAAHAQLVEHDVKVSGIQVYGAEGLSPMREGDMLDNVGFCFFTDPDGNGWAVQQISSRA